MNEAFSAGSAAVAEPALDLGQLTRLCAALCGEAERAGQSLFALSFEGAWSGPSCAAARQDLEDIQHSYATLEAELSGLQHLCLAADDAVDNYREAISSALAAVRSGIAG